MKTYICPKCKNRITEEKCFKITKKECRTCKKEMIKMYIPTKRIFEEENKKNKEISVSLLNK